MALVVRTSKSTPRFVKPVLYSDVYSNLDIELVKNDLLKLENEESVKNSIKNILLTDRGERFFNPTFGSDIRRMLFENFTPATEQILKDLIKTAIKNFEPRAEVLDVKVFGNPDENSVALTIIFSVINKSEPVTLELTLNRVR
ncbi:baseplate wedge subunit [archaeon]|nr:baseplate wedge subunit [archaeon]NDB55590.1 baseplate wedge subunit [archaeon]